MKKIAVILILLTSQYSYACVCVSVIQNSFNDTKQEIKSKLQAQKESVERLSSNIEQYTKELEKQQEEIQKVNALLKQNSVKNSNILFLLRQKIQLR